MPRVTNAGLGPGQVAPYRAFTNFSAADIQNLSVTPKVLVPAPGANKIISVLAFSMWTIPNIPNFQGQGGDQLDVFYNGQTIDLVDPSPLGGAIVTAAAYYAVSGPFNATQFTPLASYANLAVVLTGSNYAGGAIVTTSLGAGGTGYVANDTGFITGGSGVATYKVLTVGAGGAVLTYQIVSGGASYLVGNGVATTRGGAQPGVGVNFTINILTVASGTGTMKTYTYYDIIPSN